MEFKDRLPASGLGRVPGWVKLLAVFVVLYLFLVGIGAMGGAFKLMGKDFSKELLGSHAGPLVSLFIGILATTLVQSSSTTTSLVVGLVAAGAIQFDSAIYMVMGANVGTTVTNTLVSLGHITRSAEYRRAFAAASVHDLFNIMVLLVLFPLEVYTGFLTHIADAAMLVFQGVGGTRLANPIKLVTTPAIGFIQWVARDNGVAMALLGVLTTFAGLFTMVKLLRSLVLARVENLFDRTVFRTPFVGLLFGLGASLNHFYKSKMSLWLGRRAYGEVCRRLWYRLISRAAALAYVAASITFMCISEPTQQRSRG